MRNPLSLLAHENAVRIPLTHRLVFYTLNARGIAYSAFKTFKTATPDMTYYNIRT